MKKDMSMIWCKFIGTARRNRTRPEELVLARPWRLYETPTIYCYSKNYKFVHFYWSFLLTVTRDYFLLLFWPYFYTREWPALKLIHGLSSVCFLSGRLSSVRLHGGTSLRSWIHFARVHQLQLHFFVDSSRTAEPLTYPHYLVTTWTRAKCRCIRWHRDREILGKHVHFCYTCALAAFSKACCWQNSDSPSSSDAAGSLFWPYSSCCSHHPPYRCLNTRLYRCSSVLK